MQKSLWIKASAKCINVNVTNETFLSDLIDWILSCLLQDVSENLMMFRVIFMKKYRQF